MAAESNEAPRPRRRVVFEARPPRIEDVERGTTLENPPKTLFELKKILPVLSSEEEGVLNKKMREVRKIFLEGIAAESDQGTDHIDSLLDKRDQEYQAVKDTLNQGQLRMSSKMGDNISELIGSGKFGTDGQLIVKKENELFIKNIDPVLEELLAYPEDTVNLMSVRRSEIQGQGYSGPDVAGLDYSFEDADKRYQAFKQAIDEGDLNVIAVALMKAARIRDVQIQLADEAVYGKNPLTHGFSLDHTVIADPGSMSSILIRDVLYTMRKEQNDYSLLSGILNDRLNLSQPGAKLNSESDLGQLLEPYIKENVEPI